MGPALVTRAAGDHRYGQWAGGGKYIQGWMSTEKCISTCKGLEIGENTHTGVQGNRGTRKQYKDTGAQEYSSTSIQGTVVQWYRIQCTWGTGVKETGIHVFLRCKS